MALDTAVRFTGDWYKAAAALTWLERKAKAALGRSLKKEAIRLTKEQRREIKGGGTPPFQPLSTFARIVRRALGQRGSRPLLRTGLLLRSVKLHRIGKMSYFSGVKKGTVYKDDRSRIKDAMEIARLQETGRKGFVIILDRPSKHSGKTPRQWLWWLFFRGALKHPPSKGRKTMTILPAPRRPYVTQTMNRLGGNKGIGQKVMDEFVREFWTVRLPSAISLGGTERVSLLGLSL